MDIIQFIAQFFYRIRYWLLWGGFIVTALVAYFTQFLQFSYTVNSNIYAGVTNVTNIDGSKIENISSTFDNLINIAKSKSTLEKVSLRLLATNLVYGEEWQDNMYIQAKHYRQLLQHTRSAGFGRPFLVGQNRREPASIPSGKCRQLCILHVQPSYGVLQFPRTRADNRETSGNK